MVSKINVIYFWTLELPHLIKYSDDFPCENQQD